MYLLQSVPAGFCHLLLVCLIITKEYSEKKSPERYRMIKPEMVNNTALEFVFVSFNVPQLIGNEQAPALHCTNGLNDLNNPDFK